MNGMVDFRGWVCSVSTAFFVLTPIVTWGQDESMDGRGRATHGAVAETGTPPPLILDEITVTSTRTERRVDDVPNTVTVIPGATIEREGARDIKDVFRNEIDVTVRAAPTRFTAALGSTGRAGNESINIRGLEGNQVLMLVDGVRVPKSFSFGAFASGRGDFLDVDGIKAVEVLRGPASTQFGSDGLAGAVSFRTLDPGDLLKSGAGFGGFIRSSYATVDRSLANTLGVAGRRNGQWQGLLLGTLRQGNETANKGSNDALNVTRTAPNPVDYDNRYLLGKAILTLAVTHQLGVTLETQKRRQDTEVYSARAVPPLAAASTLDLDARDRLDRDRLSLQYRFNDIKASWLQRVESQVYWQDAKVGQFATEDRNTALDRTRDNSYREKVAGVSALLESNLGGWLEQRLSYGVDLSRSEITGVRDGTAPPPGESFPLKPFPDTTYTLAGAFAQSEIETGAFSIIPGLRFDRYELTPSSTGYTGSAVVVLSDQAVTPRLGVVWRAAPTFAPYAQVAQGFRAPAPDQVNNGFTNLASGYRTTGNPNLKSERADSIEIGLRGKLEGLRYSIAAFDNRYQDFISSQRVSGAGTPANPTVFQFVNFGTAKIRGVEARTEMQFGPRWVANAGVAYITGDKKINGVTTPLDTVNPLKLVLAARYDAAVWGTRANLQYNKGKEPDRIAPTTPVVPPFAPSSSTVLDFGVFWKPMRNLTVNANLNNVFDTYYWRWSDVRGLADNSTIKDAYTAPGRNAQVSVRYDFL